LTKAGGKLMDYGYSELGHADIQMLVRTYSHNVTRKQHETDDYMAKTLLINTTGIHSLILGNLI
jgi:hypothetical protein